MINIIITSYLLFCIDYTVSECDYLEVRLNNDALTTTQGHLQGAYQIDQVVNEKSSWKTASLAIWFDTAYQDWCIGYLTKTGTSECGIFF